MSESPLTPQELDLLGFVDRQEKEIRDLWWKLPPAVRDEVVDLAEKMNNTHDRPVVSMVGMLALLSLAQFKRHELEESQRGGDDEA